MALPGFSSLACFSGEGRWRALAGTKRCGQFGADVVIHNLKFGSVSNLFNMVTFSTCCLVKMSMEKVLGLSFKELLICLHINRFLCVEIPQWFWDFSLFYWMFCQKAAA